MLCTAVVKDLELRHLDVEHAFSREISIKSFVPNRLKHDENSPAYTIAEKSHVLIVSVGLTLVPKVYR